MESHLAISPSRHELPPTWRAVHLDVSAVIGQRGTAAVLRRALAIARRKRTTELSDDTGFDPGLRALESAFAGQAAEGSLAARQALAASFHDLLASLVGAALAAQLLRTARLAGQPPDHLPR